MSVRNVAIIQARMGSSRFPGKMLAELDGKPILEWVIRRLCGARTLAEVVLSTSDSEADDALVRLAKDLGISVFRGSETDVLDRVLKAATIAQADNIVRVCADNPFVDPFELDRLVEFFAATQCDYACNHQNRMGSSYSDGFGAEILSLDLVKTIARLTTTPQHREHVTLYLWENSKKYNLKAVKAPKNIAYPHLRFDVDLPEDLVGLKSLVEGGVTIESSAEQIVKVARLKNFRSISYQSKHLVEEMDLFLKRLFPLCRSITGEPNRETLRIIQEIIPLKIHEVPSGEKVFDWTIPDEWSIRDASISDIRERKIVDFQQNNLHVISYSEPVNEVLSWEDLQPHLHCCPELPEAIPYRTSYYNRSWGFCVTRKQYLELKAQKNPLKVVIDSDLNPGSLSYGEYLIRGRSKKEILLSCYICHPSMANDSLSGVLLTAFLARDIAKIKNLHWSYRIVFVPETIGAIAYCAKNEMAMKEVDMGLVITTVGGPTKFGYKQSYDAGHPINRLIEEVFAERGVDFVKYPFDVHGSDERQYSSQGFRINVATISKDRYYEYPYYHSSLDDLAFVNANQIVDTLGIYARLIEKIEARQVYFNKIPNCELMLSRHNLYPKMGGAQLPGPNSQSDLDLILWLLFWCDGNLSIQDIANKLGVNVKRLAHLADTMVTKGVLEEL